MPSEPIAERTFRAADQKTFAVLSGDCNPLHMDALAARRTLAGFPVVHGIHLLLWALEAFVRVTPRCSSIATLKVAFQKMVHVGERVQLLLVQSSDSRAALELMVDDARVTTIRIGLGAPIDELAPPSDPPKAVPESTSPLPRSFAELADESDAVRVGADPNVAATFPALAEILGAPRTAALVRTSYLVGMICPGLHSIYAGLDLEATSVIGSEHLHFRVASTDPRFRLVKLAVAGCGWTGGLDTHVRPEPVAQPSYASVAPRVAATEFAGSRVLVVGGSRGLGELVAKISAAGGADVTITYASGAADAARVQREIEAAGGRCATARYEVRQGPNDLIDGLAAAPDALYYFASPPIFQKKGSAFSPALFETFVAFYVNGFYGLCRAVKTTFRTRVPAFYPSSVAVETRPAGLTEYAMAKAAGELLCADMSSEGLGPVLVRRLPRLATDQTATIRDVDVADSLELMLAVVRDLHAMRAQAPGRV